MVRVSTEVHWQGCATTGMKETVVKKAPKLIQFCALIMQVLSGSPVTNPLTKRGGFRRRCKIKEGSNSSRNSKLRFVGLCKTNRIPKTRRQVGEISKELGENSTRPHDIRIHFRGRDNVFKDPNPNPRDEQSKVQCSREENIDSEIGKLLEKGAIELVEPMEGQFVGHLFLREKKNGGFRPVFNLKPLNRFIMYRHFKMEIMGDLLNMLKLDDYMVKIDLKDAYFSVPIAPKHRKFLRFGWKWKLYQFLVMAFGLGPAPRIFTKILKPVISLFRRMGLRILIFLDDKILLNQNKEQLMT